MSTLEEIAAKAQAVLKVKNLEREQALTSSRGIIRLSANAIRAIHRGEMAQAEQLLGQAGTSLTTLTQALAEHQDLFYAGFVQDAQKEYAEARITKALLAGEELPDPDDLGVCYPPYLNGLGEAVGELRRHLLDCLRQGDVQRGEEILPLMDDILGLLASVDYPEAITGGLRRTADAMRALIERSRGDLTIAVRQRELENALSKVQGELKAK